MSRKQTCQILVLLCCLCLGIFGSHAQNRTIKKADSAFKYRMYNDACTLYQKGFAKLKAKDKELKDRVLFQIAECYRYSGDIKKAVSQYGRCVRARYYTLEPIVYYHLGYLQLGMGDFEEANLNFNEYLDYIPDDSVAIALRDASLYVEELMQRPTRYEIDNVRKLNSKDGDWNPRYYTEEGDIIAFSSTREGVVGKKFDAWTGERFSDIFVAKTDAKGNWSKPELLDQNKKISTPANESDASFCNNGQTIYYTMCNNKAKTKNRCEIWTSTFNGTNWSDPKAVNFAGDTSSDFIHPHITPDGGTLYFSSNRSGGYGDLDIWYATGSGSEFGTPVNLGPYVNTSKKEVYPFKRNDTLLAFSSNGHKGLGGLDIYLATLKQDTFRDIHHLGYPLNSNSDDFGICYLPDQNKGMFSSNRSGSKRDDIYSFFLPDIVFSISGTIKNASTLQYIGEAEVNLAGSDGSLLRTLSNSKGYYMFDSRQIKPKVTYQLLIEKKGFFSVEASETTVGLTNSKDFIRDFDLIPIPKEPVVLPEILYDLGKWDLKEQYQDSLINLIVLLEKNPRLVIELASHTDARPIAMGNDVLSQNRAQSVVDYLVLRGIHPERLQAKGYGDAQPRRLSKPMQVKIKDELYLFDSGVVLTKGYIDSLDNKDAREAAHQLNRRTEFSILRDDFIPSGQKNSKVLIGLGKVEDFNKINFQYNPDKNIEFTVIANGNGLQTTLDPKAKTAYISQETVMQLLWAGKLNKNNFKNKEKAFDEDGEVLVNQKLSIRELKVGNYLLKNVEVTTQNELSSELVLTPAILKGIGKYHIDEETQQIIFEK